MEKTFSTYNTTLRINSDYGVCYNAMSDRFVVLKPQVYDELCKGDVAGLAEKFPEPYKQLVDVRAIVDSDVDEVQQVRDMIDRVDNDESTFHLHVNPTVDCNFRCWYCYENHVKGSKMQPDMVEKVKTLMEKTIVSHRQLKSFVLSFFGGEPLMYFNAVVKPLMEHLYSLCGIHALQPFVSFTTNGFLLNEKMVEFFDGKDVSFQITLDGDRERHDKTRFMPTGKGSFDRIVDNIKLLSRHGHQIIMRINYTADNISSVMRIAEEFADLEKECKNLVTVDFQRVWQDRDMAQDEDAVDTEMYMCVKMFHDNGFSVSCSKTNNGVLDSCYGSKRNYALVNYNGDVYQCTARDFNKENRYGYLTESGDIVYENGLKKKRESARFSKEVCHNCRIAPICGGGCAQKAMEFYNKDVCALGFTDAKIDKYVLDRFEYGLLLERMNDSATIVNL